MIKLTGENTQNAITKCKQLKPTVRFIKDKFFAVESETAKNSVNANVAPLKKVWFAINWLAGATVNIYRQGLKRQAA